MSTPKSNRAHLIVGGFPAGATAGHDMDYARIRLLNMLSNSHDVATTVSNDFSDIGRWLDQCRLLVTYVAGPYPNEEQCAHIRDWVAQGGRWLALHGTSGGKAAKISDTWHRKMVKTKHHDLLGCFFLNHPPVRKFTVNVEQHPLTEGVQNAFDVMDELYLLEIQDSAAELLITTQLEKDPSPKGFGFVVDKDTSLQPDGKTRVLGFLRNIGDGSIIYYALGHCHSPTTNIQPFVDSSVAEDGTTPLDFKGPWESPDFQKLLQNAIDWSLTA